MAERYTRLFGLTENLYQSGSPLLIAAGALLKDTQTGRVLAQLKLQSLSGQPIKAVKVNITPIDVTGATLGDTIEHQYLDLNVKRDEAFGTKSPVYLPNATARGFTAEVRSVVFADNSVWTASDAAWEPLPAPVPLEKAYPDAELRKQFKLEFGAKNQYAYTEFADLCRCPCGALNRKSEGSCHTCGCDLTTLRTLDSAELEKRKEARLEQERIAEEERQKQERIAEEKRQERARIEAAEAAERAKKAKKIAIIAAPIVCVVIAFLIVLSSVIIPSNRYNKAVELMEAGKYEEAIAAFEDMDGYKDSTEKIYECVYCEAIGRMEAGEFTEAALLFAQLGDYKDAHERSLSAWDSGAERATIAAGSRNTIGLKSDGTVVAVGDNEYGQCDVGDWTDIVAVAAFFHTVGLKSDNTVVAVGYNNRGQCDVENWEDIVAVAAGGHHTVGLKADGTVVAVGRNKSDLCDVEQWTDIVAVAAGDYHTVGLKSDGTVVAVGDNDYGQCNVGDWADIVAVAAGDYHTVGLKSDGTVVATVMAVGYNNRGQCDVENWEDIVAVAAGSRHTVGLKADGTVVAVGDNEYGQCNVSGWRDIVAVDALAYHTVGLQSDGTVDAVGYNGFGQLVVGRWSDIKLPE